MHMTKAALRGALIRWGKLCGNMNLMVMSETIVQEERAIEAGNHALTKTNAERKQFADKSSRAMGGVQAELEQIKLKTENTMARLIFKNQENYYTPKIAHVFQGWREYTSRRRRCCQILTTAMHKTAMSKAFILINQYQRATHHAKT